MRVLVTLLVALTVGQQNVTTTPIVLYVTTNGTLDPACGTAIDNACLNIETAITVYSSIMVAQDLNVTTSSLTIKLANGTYAGVYNKMGTNLFGFNFTLEAADPTAPMPVLDGEYTSQIMMFYEPKAIVPYPPNTATYLNFNNITFINGVATNTSEDRDPGGGAIYVTAVQFPVYVSLTSCKFANNSGYNVPGGAIHIDLEGDHLLPTQVSLKVEGCAFRNNSVHMSDGGAIAVSSATLVVRRSIFSNNTALRGGAISLHGGNMTISHMSGFLENSCFTVGGAIYLQNAYDLSYVDNVIFYANTGGMGGAIGISHAVISVKNGQFDSNIASSWGGAIYVGGPDGYLNLTLGSLSGNKAGQGGAIYLGDSYSLLTNSSFHDNDANLGGTIYNDHSDIVFNSVAITSSYAETEGGAIYTLFGTLFMDSTWIKNSVAEYGAAIFCGGSKINATDSLFIFNNTDTMNTTDSDIVLNDYNVYCSLDPPHSHCEFYGSELYSGLCGEVQVHERSGMTKGQLAGIIIGVVLGASVIAFGLGMLAAKSTIRSYFVPLVKDQDDDDSISS
eukprot:gene5965-6909_t